jgi:hypothetical protein
MLESPIADSLATVSSKLMPLQAKLPPHLAPLQCRMVRDSLAQPRAGHHLEQLDLQFASCVARDRIVRTWQAMVEATEALHLAFPTSGGTQSEWAIPPALQIAESRPPSWDRWLNRDRHEPLLVAGRVPWRATFWPTERRLIWTFHHALLDGRSITCVLRSFLSRLAGEQPEPLRVSHWPLPSATAIAQAESMFQAMESTAEGGSIEWADPAGSPATRSLGHAFASDFQQCCNALQVSPAAALIWCWGQALTQVFGQTALWVEQVRVGAPQPGTAGFTMTTQPVAIHRHSVGDPGDALREFRDYLLRLRAIESVSPEDVAPGIYPNLDGPESSVVMVEHGTLAHQVGFSELLESIELIEPEGDGLAASAHLAPDLQLRVDGPRNHQLLDAWSDAVMALTATRS